MPILPRKMVKLIADKYVAGETEEHALLKTKELNLKGLDLERSVASSLLAIDKKQWTDEIAEITEYFSGFGDRLPTALSDRAEVIRAALAAV